MGAQDDANVIAAPERVDLVVPAELVSLVVAIGQVRGGAVVAEVVVEAHVVFLLVDAAAGGRGSLGVWRAKNAADATHGSGLLVNIRGRGVLEHVLHEALLGSIGAASHTVVVAKVQWVVAGRVGVAPSVQGLHVDPAGWTDGQGKKCSCVESLHLFLLIINRTGHAA